MWPTYFPTSTVKMKSSNLEKHLHQRKVRPGMICHSIRTNTQRRYLIPRKSPTVVNEVNYKWLPCPDKHLNPVLTINNRITCITILCSYHNIINNTRGFNQLNNRIQGDFISRHMVNITQEQPSIEKCWWLFSNRVQSHRSCEPNKYRISKPFVLFFQSQASGRYYQIK